jgi:hypothetical protein
MKYSIVPKNLHQKSNAVVEKEHFNRKGRYVVAKNAKLFF